MNAAVIDSLVDHATTAGSDDDIRVIVLRTAGDVEKLGTLQGEEATPVVRRDYINEGIHRLLKALHEVA